MWPLPIIRDEYIALSISPTHIAYAWLHASKKYPLILKAYCSTPFETITITALEQQLNQFIATYNLKNARIGITLAAPHIHEQLVRLPHATPTVHDFGSPILKTMMWDYRYLHTLDDNQHLFYVCGISRPVLFAQQLLAYKTKLNLTSVTSCYMGLLYAYRTLFGPAFRQSQMALDMMRTDYKLENSMSVENISRLLHIPPSLNLDLHAEKISLLTMIGLYYQER